MDSLLRAFGELIPATIIALPFAILAWLVLTERRSGRRPLRTARRTAALDVAIGTNVIIVCFLVTVPVPGRPPTDLHLRLGTDLVAALTPAGSPWQVVGNLVLLAPLGALIPLRVRASRSLIKLALAALVVSTIVEVGQYLLHTGRVTSTDDIVLNTLGAVAGARLARRWWAPRYPGVDAIPAPRTSSPPVRSLPRHPSR
ncbi:VanZ family protein [Amycolatopsis cihanbeyliensis]|uniref:VanZ like protein n=1 Tax=Amycolatopsis cihanbeyliensis TaxID=1128664 RepID=A0A542DKU8_AMYCI|nr:VanZ family protein [Amycolatopsis cihanbeyliensis]TQJ03545.1 VanZ like protein [Amycolatopsis cihanbeyliensis]